MSDQDLGPRDAGMQDRSDWEDRLVDRALQELHGDRPPDLLPAIERRLIEESTVAPLRGLGRAARTRVPVRLASVVLLAAALLFMAIGLVVHWSRGGRAERVPAVQVAVEVMTGGLELADGGGSGAGAPRVLEPGGAQMVLLQRGDRLRSLARGNGDGTELVIGPFGMVRMAPQTLMEVKEMDVELKNGWVAAGSLTFAVVAGAASWHLITHREQAQAGEVLRLEAPNQSALQTQLQTALGDAQRLQQENQDLKQRMLALEEQNRRQPVAVPEPQPLPAEVAPPVPVVASAVTFDDARFRDALAKVDWQVMGSVSKEMGSMLVALATALEKGEDVPLDVAAKIQELNAQLVKQLPVLMKADLPGSGPNGVFTHPLVVGNQLASMLESAGQPLSSGQRTLLESIVHRYTLENDGVHQQEGELGLQTVIAELAMKDRFYDELSAQLRPDQRDVMYPEGAGRYGTTSLFRSGIVWSTLCERVDAGNPADYAKSMSASMGKRLGLDEGAAARVQAIVEEVSRTAPAALWQPGAAIEQRGFQRSERAPLAAETQLAWMQRVLREVPLSAEQKKKLQQMRGVFVPVSR